MLASRHLQTTEKTMRTSATLALLVAGSIAAPVLAQTTGSEVQRNTNQQQRIEQGLQSGALTTHEAGQLERQQTQVDRMEKNALKDGSLSPAEKARIEAAQNKTGKSIAADKHNAKLGNPASKSSQRMQADVQRNVNQQARIEQGVKSGQLSNKQVASLERGQAHVNRAEANVAANGRVGAVEQANVQGKENVQSARVHNKKTNATAQP
jgi:hypothetical protein